MTLQYTLYSYFINIYTILLVRKNFHKINLYKFETVLIPKEIIIYLFFCFCPLAVCYMNESMKQIINVFMYHLLGNVKVKKKLITNK